MYARILCEIKKAYLLTYLLMRKKYALSQSVSKSVSKNLTLHCCCSVAANYPKKDSLSSDELYFSSILSNYRQYC